MRTTDIEEANRYTLKTATAGFTEFVCPSCNQSFYFINEKNMWENYGIWLHTTCLKCGYTRKLPGAGFKQNEHQMNMPP
jgi:Zn ribbon nucleic-acid-binding protein